MRNEAYARPVKRRLKAGGSLKAAPLSLSLLCCATLLQAQQRGLLKSEFIFETAPFPSCHASTIVEVNGALVCAWFGGTAERNRDVGIWLSRLVDGKWTAPVEVANGV